MCLLKNKERLNAISSFERLIFRRKSLVTMARWTHLYPSRTQKLSTVTAIVSVRREEHVAGLFFALFIYIYK